MTIIWSQKAGVTFQANIDYLKENWTQTEVDRFIARVFKYLEILSIEHSLLAKRIKPNIHTLV